MISLDVLPLLTKHLRVVKQSSLPSKQSNNYHPLQNINEGMCYVRNKALSLCSELEARVTKSLQNKEFRETDKNGIDFLQGQRQRTARKLFFN